MNVTETCTIFQRNMDFPVRHCATCFACCILFNPYNNPMRCVLSVSSQRAGIWDLEHFSLLTMAPELMRSGTELDDVLSLFGNICSSGYKFDFQAWHNSFTVAGTKWITKSWVYQKWNLGPWMLILVGGRGNGVPRTEPESWKTHSRNQSLGSEKLSTYWNIQGEKYKVLFCQWKGWRV